MDQNLPFRKFQPKKRLLKILGNLSRVKIRWKWAIVPFFRCSKIIGEATLGIRGFSRVRWEFSVLAEGRHVFDRRRVSIKTWQKPETALEKCLAPRVRRGRQARNFTTNVPKILDLKSSSEHIFFENWRWVPLFIYGTNVSVSRSWIPLQVVDR